VEVEGNKMETSLEIRFNFVLAEEGKNDHRRTFAL